MTDARKKRVMKKHGFVHFASILAAAEEADIDLSLLCAVLEQESGDRNIYGHDPVKAPQRQGGKVTPKNYAEYKRLRKAGYGMQGVGPMQLTWWQTQDFADRLGGCWRPSVNIKVGALTLAENIEKHGYAKGIARYNGSGPRAWAYSLSVRRKVKVWHRRFING